MKDYCEQDWNFLNMNSPADLSADYNPDGVHLNEYDRCRDGHGLVSRFFVNKEDTSFKTQIVSLGAGIGIGLYFGDGCYKDYVMIVADKKGISVRIPNGVPMGDTFRMEGPKRYYEIAAKKMCLGNSFTIGFEKKNHRLAVFINDDTLIEIDRLSLPFSTKEKNAKIIVKAYNEDSNEPKSESVMKGCTIKGIADCYDFYGICTDSKTKNILPDVYVHALGEYEKWAKTSEEGRFIIKDLPYGTYRFAYGMEGKEFFISDVIHDGREKKIGIDFSMIATDRENVPQENLKSNLPFMGLNGLWKFEFDRNNIGEEEEWFIDGNHDFSKCIRVPFSWQSLKAFGEEELADGYSLHQANSFTCNGKEIGETGWYQRTFSLSEKETRNEIEIVFGAISGTAKVWLNEKQIGCTTDSYHKYAFSLGRLKSNQNYTLTVKVEYEHGNHFACSGKQGFWFTDSPGIWQNVWLREKRGLTITEILIDYEVLNKEETRLDYYLELSAKGRDQLWLEPKENHFLLKAPQSGYYKIVMNYTASYETDCEVFINGSKTGMHLLFDAVHKEYYDKKEYYCYLNAGRNEIEFYVKEQDFTIVNVYAERIETDAEIDLWMDDIKIAGLLPKVNLTTGMLECRFTYHLKEVKFWSPGKPYQYRVAARIKSGNEITEYTRKLGIREVGISSMDNLGGTYITLNHQKIYIRGVLDQGYNPWGLYTYPSLRGGAGSGEYDILAAKDCGYNLIRMHVKDNEPDWYDICDETGMLVWDEAPSNFYGIAEDRHWQSMFRRQLKQMVKKHNYHTSIILCSTINESWGITGDHEKSPWEDYLGQELIRKYGKYYKEKNKHALVIDNSGYGKTSETQVIDHHSYPGGFEDARDFFGRIVKQNYKGSHFNFYHSRNSELFQDASVADLLQRNCSQDLKTLNYIGAEVQNGQPVIISEFVHTDKQEELVRKFPQIAGYVRMNIASQENEDTSPLTATRIWRDFGIVTEDFTRASYGMVNSEDFIYMDYPFLSKAFEREKIDVPIYVSLWSKSPSEWREIEVLWKFTGIDRQGRYKDTEYQGCFHGTVERNKPTLFETLKMEIPQELKGGYLFVKLLSMGKELASSYIQMEIFPEKESDLEKNVDPNFLELTPSDIIEIDGFQYSNIYEKNTRNLVWGYGGGRIEYKKSCLTNRFRKAVLTMELSDCICIQGTRETDELLEDSSVKLYIQDELVETLKIKGQSCDRRALFSNSSSSEDKIIRYAQTGTYGYGRRVEVEIPPHIIEKMKRDRTIIIRLEAVKTGITIYGNRMGSHGSNPTILLT